MGSFPAARSIPIVKALLSQAPPEQSHQCQGCSGSPAVPTRAQPSSLTPCAPLWPLPSAPGPALAWLGHAGLCSHGQEQGLALAYRAQQGEQAQALLQAEHSVIHLHRDQAQIHYSRLCIRPNKVKQPCLTEKTAPPTFVPSSCCPLQSQIGTGIRNNPNHMN